jgi:AmmeMemoRadiSam system protein B
MRTIIIVLLLIIANMEMFSQNRTFDRQPVVSGSFYSADKVTLTKELSELFKNCKKSPGNSVVRAIISPHAGYIFSGKIAASAYSTINRNRIFKNVFIIGSSHVMHFEGASVFNSGDFITPMGKIEVNRTVANKIIKENRVFNFPTTAHLQEHSIEVQLPFIQFYFQNDPLIVPIIIGTNNQNTIRKIAEALRPWFTSENLFVISSDFSHYPPYKEAVESDNATALSIASGDPQIFLNTLKENSAKQISGLVTSMCGWTSGLTLLYMAEGNNNLKVILVDYCNSGDSPAGGKDRVVGYHAITMIEKFEKTEDILPESKNEFSFTI